MFDSDDIDRVNRTFGPELFEKIAWDVQDGNRSMSINLDSVSVNDMKLARHRTDVLREALRIGRSLLQSMRYRGPACRPAAF